MNAQPAAGVWADLVPVAAGERVVVCGAASPAAVRRLRDRGAVVSQLHDGGSADVMIVVRVGTADLAAMADSLPPGGRLVVVDRGRPGSHSTTSCRATRRGLARLDRVSAVHPFGLFRSLDAPTTAFRLDEPALAALVLRAVAVGAPRARRWGLDLLRRLAERSRAELVAPAWLLIAHIEAHPDPLAPSGRIGVAANDQGVVLLGVEPDQVEKVYTDAEEADRVAAAHRELDDAGVRTVQVVRGRPSPNRLRFDWVDGVDLDGRNMALDELVTWTVRAAEALGEIHRATRDASGLVLNHGDYWLGAVVARGDQIAAIIDWSDAGRGAPHVDTRTLVDMIRRRFGPDGDAVAVAVDRIRRRYEAAGGPAGAFDEELMEPLVDA